MPYPLQQVITAKPVLAMGSSSNSLSIIHILCKYSLTVSYKMSPQFSFFLALKGAISGSIDLPYLIFDEYYLWNLYQYKKNVYQVFSDHYYKQYFLILSISNFLVYQIKSLLLQFLVQVSLFFLFYLYIFQHIIYTTICFKLSIQLSLQCPLSQIFCQYHNYTPSISIISFNFLSVFRLSLSLFTLKLSIVSFGERITFSSFGKPQKSNYNDS